MSNDIVLGDGAEFDAIRLLLERWGARAEGVGDDGAVWQPRRGERIVASVDSVVDGRHFRREWLSPREIGYRAVAAALSDLAAMAARPTGVLIALVVPQAWRDMLADIADGIGDAVEYARTVVRGGNMSGGTELSITTTVFGEVFVPLTRSGAWPGDRVYVTGRLGAPGAALAALNRGEKLDRFLERFVHPVPRLREARWLASHGATAAIDISDGLVADARHLAAASNARLELDALLLPIFEGVSRECALESGEEYELIVTAEALDTTAFELTFGIPLTAIGRVSECANEGATGVHIAGARVEKRAGHDHFSR